MNPLLKHSIILAAAVLLSVSVAVFLPMPAEDDAALGSVGFGYPFPFLKQDFSDQIVPSIEFSRFVGFDVARPVSDFSLGGFLMSSFMTILCLEVVIVVLEFLKDRLFATDVTD